MRWQIGRRSTNVEDRRGMRASGGLVLGGGGLLLVVLVSTFLGVDPTVLLQGLEQVQVTTQPGGEAPAPPENDEQAEFVARVLGDTEDTWQAIFAAAGRSYEPPRLVLFTDAVGSACGFGSAAMGPFYCPLDRKVYIDLGFFRELDERFGAPGDFARAYVIAHEVGHHVQTLLGISDRVHERAAAAGGRERNALSVRQELQADCLAGVWGHHANRERKMLEEGDAEEGLAAAAAIGDDRLQRQSGGAVQPETWTHGSSEERVRWLRRGLERGTLDDCDTFAGS
ncbi:MAG: uncharacterized protein QOD06_2161 [Candidatus Binatota bacterium]|jgi:predicted metalloprotease|nr:uncharacterized protein [Candidatus Binatota bacterium]